MRDLDRRAADLIAWSAKRNRVATWLGALPMLGMEQAQWRPEDTGPLPVHRKPSSWFRAGRRGVIILDYWSAASWLHHAPPLLVSTPIDGAVLRDNLTIPAPKIVVGEVASVNRSKTSTKPCAAASIRSGPSASMSGRRMTRRGESTASTTCRHRVAEAPKAEPVKITADPFTWRDPKTFPRRAWLYWHHLIRKFITCTVSPAGSARLARAGGSRGDGERPPVARHHVARRPLTVWVSTWKTRWRRSSAA